MLIVLVLGEAAGTVGSGGAGPGDLGPFVLASDHLVVDLDLGTRGYRMGTIIAQERS